MPSSTSEELSESRAGTTRRAGYFREWYSRATICGIPLIHVTTHVWDPHRRSVRCATAIFAIGPLAFGFIAVGWAAAGVIVLGLPVGAGLVASVGMIALGGLFALGNIALALGFATGNIALGAVAYGQIAAQYRRKPFP